MKHLLRLALIGSALPLAGCMTTGTNMHGDFACRAPNGTCAPMSSIDAKAVAGMGASAQPIGGIVDPAMPREGRMVTASADGTPPGRTADRVLRVVFPAHIDASGIYHDELTAHAVIERGAWTDGLTGGRQSPVTTATIADRAVPDASSSKLASLDEVIAARAASGKPGAMSAPVPGAARPSEPQAVRTPVSLRSTAAIDLREAAAAATAGPVSGLDPNFDTPDVSAIEASDTVPATGTCVAFHMVRWHGHAYRRPFKAPCPVEVAAAADARTPAVVARPGTTAALNRASIERTAAPVSVATVAPPVASPATLATSTLPSATATTSNSPTALLSPAPSTPRFAPTADPKVAAARVSSLAAPVVDGQVALGRDAAHAAVPPELGSLFAGGAPAAAQGVGAPR